MEKWSLARSSKLSRLKQWYKERVRILNPNTLTQLLKENFCTRIEVNYSQKLALNWLSLFPLIFFTSFISIIFNILHFPKFGASRLGVIYLPLFLIFWALPHSFPFDTWGLYSSDACLIHFSFTGHYWG